MVSRLKLQYCKIVLATSLVWFLLDVVLLMYFTDCANNSAKDCNSKGRDDRQRDGGGGSLLERILPKEPVDSLIVRGRIPPTKKVISPPKPHLLFKGERAVRNKIRVKLKKVSSPDNHDKEIDDGGMDTDQDGVGVSVQSDTAGNAFDSAESEMVNNAFDNAESETGRVDDTVPVVIKGEEDGREAGNVKHGKTKYQAVSNIEASEQEQIVDGVETLDETVDTAEAEKSTTMVIENIKLTDNNVNDITDVGEPVNVGDENLLEFPVETVEEMIEPENDQVNDVLVNSEANKVVTSVKYVAGDQLHAAGVYTETAEDNRDESEADLEHGVDEVQDNSECVADTQQVNFMSDLDNPYVARMNWASVPNELQQIIKERDEQDEHMVYEGLRRALECERDGHCIRPPWLEEEYAYMYDKEYYQKKHTAQGLIGRPAFPGDMGKAVVIPPDKLDESKEKFKIHQFNLVASEMMSLNRTLPDYRIPGCRNKKYGSLSDLPDTSVVIVFHNEAWSTLLRTVHSVINRSPPPLLKEIILVDDASEREELGSKLDEYLATLHVHTYAIRMEERTGLIRARLKGAAKAKGKVITFLDAHCEATEGWLEPLMHEIYKDRTAVACPIIDVISDDTFEYITGSDMTWGGFNWKLNFRWYPVPQRELDRRGGDRSQPVRTPTMAGGLFSIDRDYFYEVGSYDEGMDIWGAENLEMSFRVWMCGGKVYIVTCSRVGHVFRKTSPYSWPGGVARIINHNTQRIVEVWMDEYKDFFYKINPGVKNTDYGDVSERKDFRKHKECKSFKWYLENIYPESQMPLDFYALGEVKNKETGACIDSMGRKSGEKVGLVHCHGMGGNQIFSYTGKQALQTDDVCIDVSAIGGPVKLFQCHGLGGNQKWEYSKEVFSYTGKRQLMMDENVCLTVVRDVTKFTSCSSAGLEFEHTKEKLELRHVNSNQCLGRSTSEEHETPSVGPCDGSEGQKWSITDMKW